MRKKRFLNVLCLKLRKSEKVLKLKDYLLRIKTLRNTGYAGPSTLYPPSHFSSGLTGLRATDHGGMPTPAVNDVHDDGSRDTAEDNAREDAGGTVGKPRNEPSADEVLARISSVPGIGDKLMEKMVKRFGSPEALARVCNDFEIDRLARIEGIGELRLLAAFLPMPWALSPAILILLMMSPPETYFFLFSK